MHWITLKPAPGQARDDLSAADVLVTSRESDELLPDRAYDSDALRPNIAARGA